MMNAPASQRALMVMGAVGTGCLALVFFGWCLAKCQLVGGFEGCAAHAADDSGAVAADEGIIDHPRAGRAPEIGFVLRGLWIVGHAVLSLAKMRKASEATGML
jgi:hypothetical protein